jgi:hypothetical protein
MKMLIATTIVLVSLSGCIPLVIGGYIGYQMSQAHEHDAWCAQNIGDITCHP